MKVIVCVGLPGSGKSTWAKKEVEEKTEQGEKWIRLNRDSIRDMFCCGYSKDSEPLVRFIEWDSVTTALNFGYNVIVDDTNLTEDHILKITSAIFKRTYKEEVTLEFKSFLGVSVDECKRRNALRPEKTRVPDHEIDRMAILANELKLKLENEKYRNKQF